MLAVLDADGDGDLDVAAGLRWLRHEPGLVFTELIVGPPQGSPDYINLNPLSVLAGDVNADGRLEFVIGSSSWASGWFESFSVGDYDRDGRVDESDRNLWEQMLGLTVGVPGAGADGDKSGVVDDADLDLWEQHIGEHLIPKVDAANSAPFDPGQSELIDGFDFLAWQRNVGGTSIPALYTDWNGNGTVDGPDLEIWKDQYGEGLIPDVAWINSRPATPAIEPAVAPAAELAIAANVILSLKPASAAPSRPTFAPRPRTTFSTAHDALFARLAEAPPIRAASPQLAILPPADADGENEAALTDAIFASLANSDL
jgi:hypothetical protein